MQHCLRHQDTRPSNFLDFLLRSAAKKLSLHNHRLFREKTFTKYLVVALKVRTITICYVYKSNLSPRHCQCQLCFLEKAEDAKSNSQAYIHVYDLVYKSVLGLKGPIVPELIPISME